MYDDTLKQLDHIIAGVKDLVAERDRLRAALEALEQLASYYEMPNTTLLSAALQQARAALARGEKAEGSMICPNCRGDGWLADHSDSHYAGRTDEDCGPYGCPVQRPCAKCEGTGQIKDGDQ